MGRERPHAPRADARNAEFAEDDDHRRREKIGAGDLKGIVVDSDELKKGTELFDRKAFANFARYGSKIYGEAKGSSASPYRVTITFGDGAMDVSARCTCPAARSRRFCKHAAGLLVAWARAPEGFVESDGPAGGGGTKAAKKPSAKEVVDLRRRGVLQATTLVRELASSGVASLGADRPEQIRALAQALRDNKLRRLSARTMDLAGLLEAAFEQKSAPPSTAYAELVSDLLLTARKLERHFGGEPIDDRHVEELIGKNWQKQDRTPVSGLDLIEYAYLERTTSDDFAIRESRLFDLASGAHYSEKQIVPVFRLRFTEQKPSRGGRILGGARGGAFPGYPPVRLDLSDLGDPAPIDAAALGRLVDRALPDVSSAIAALHEHRKDIFAPDRVPVAIRADALLARGARLLALDARGHAIHLPEDVLLEEQLGAALHRGRLAALLGDLGTEAAVPTLWPLAAVIEVGRAGPEIVFLSSSPSSEGTPTRAAAGASGAATMLAEAREELADAFVLGLASLNARRVDPIAARLRDLGLAKQAALAEAIAAKEPAEERLDDFVKLYQVLGIALLRLASAAEVDRDGLAPVPLYESVLVERPAAALEPRAIDAARAAGAINRYEAAIHRARYYEGLSAEELAASVLTLWGDGSAAPYVVRALAVRRDEGLAAAKRALGARVSRTAKMTALQVLGAIGGIEAESILHQAATGERDMGLRAVADDALAAAELRRVGPEVLLKRRAPRLQKIAELAEVLRAAPNRDARVHAIELLGGLGDLAAIPALRQAFFGDASVEVRREAALALALLGDADMVEPLLRMLRARAGDAASASIAAEALGLLGDARGLHELLTVYAEGHPPPAVGHALATMGPIAIEPLLDLVDASPEIAERRTAVEILGQLAERELAASLVARLRARPRDASFPDAARLYLKLAAVHPDVRRAVAAAVLDVPEAQADKALVRAAKRALA